MKYLTIILLIAVVACGCANAAKKQPMSFEDIDFDTVIKNERLMKNYMACMTNSGPCTQEGRELKKAVPEALNTACAKCTPKQKTTARRMVKYLQEKRPKDWAKLLAVYDPKGLNKEKYDTFINGQD